MGIVAGTCFVKVNGTQLSLRGNVELSPGTTEKESVVGIDQYHGVKSMPKPTIAVFDVTDDPTVDIAQTWETLTGVTLTFELANGKTITFANATQMNHLTLNAEDGKLQLRFEGAASTCQTTTATAAQQAT